MTEISDKTIAKIADSLREDFIDEMDDPISDSDLEFAVENWLLRTIHHIEGNPAFYAAGVRVYRSSHIPELELKPQCENIWCLEKPDSKSIFCKDHNRIFTR